MFIRPATTWGCATAALILGALILGTMATSSTALADTSYLKPNVFTTANADIVTVQSSFTEDFPNPSVAVKSVMTDTCSFASDSAEEPPPQAVRPRPRVTREGRGGGGR